MGSSPSALRRSCNGGGRSNAPRLWSGEQGIEPAGSHTRQLLHARDRRCHEHLRSRDGSDDGIDPRGIEVVTPCVEHELVGVLEILAACQDAREVNRRGDVTRGAHA